MRLRTRLLALYNCFSVSRFSLLEFQGNRQQSSNATARRGAVILIDSHEGSDLRFTGNK